MKNEMTAEEAVKILKEQQAEFNETWIDYGRVNKAYNKAIQALEAQPSEDCISRQAVLNIFDEWFATCNIADKRESPKAKINALPSVKPKYTDEEIDKAQAVEQAYVDKMVELAVEEAKRPKGEWIDFNWNDGDICRWGIKCSECHTEYKHGGEMWHNPKFCPNCGSYNGGGEDGNI